MPSYVTVTGTIPNAAEGQPVTGTAVVAPSGWLPDPDDGLLFPPDPASFPVVGGRQWSASLLPTDTPGTPANWTWSITITIDGVMRPLVFSFELPYNGGAPRDISELAQVPAIAPSQEYVPLPASGTPEAGAVLEATGVGGETEWGSVGGGAVASVNDQTGAVVLDAADVGADTSGAAAAAQSAAETYGASQAAGAQAAAETYAAGQASSAQSAAETYAAAQASAAQSAAETAAAGVAGTAQSNAETFATSAVGTETARAEAAEATAQANAETAATSDVAAETTRAETAETAAQSAAETFATTAAGTALSGAESAALADMAAEATRAEAAEGSNATAVTTETGRAQTAEGLLAPKANAALTGSPTAPTKAALTGNTDIATTAYSDSAVAVETSRAEAAESTDAAATGTETTRAEGAESINASAISTETSRAETTEGGLVPLADLPISIANGGHGKTTAAAGYNALSPMTTTGDIEYESAAGTASRLAGNPSTQKEFLSQAGTGSASAAPAWSTVPGQFLCAPNFYKPSSLASPAVTSATFAAFSTGVICTNSFIAPASGEVVVTASFVADDSASGDEFSFGLAATGTVTPLIGQVISFNGGLSTSVGGWCSLEFVVAGLTPGNTYQLDLLGGSTSGTGTITILAFGTTSTTVSSTRGAPVVMKVLAV